MYQWLMKYHGQFRVNIDSNIACRVTTEEKSQEKVSSVINIISKVVDEFGRNIRR